MTATDEYSRADTRSQFRGFQHQLTRMNSDWVDLWERLKALEEQVKTLVESRERDKAEIGKLQESLDKIEEARRAYAAKKGEEQK